MSFQSGHNGSMSWMSGRSLDGGLEERAENLIVIECLPAGWRSAFEGLDRLVDALFPRYSLYVEVEHARLRQIDIQIPKDYERVWSPGQSRLLGDLLTTFVKQIDVTCAVCGAHNETVHQRIENTFAECHDCHVRDF